MDARINSEAVAHTPQPHIGEAYVGGRKALSHDSNRSAVPNTNQSLLTIQPVLYIDPLFRMDTILNILNVQLTILSNSIQAMGSRIRLKAISNILP